MQAARALGFGSFARPKAAHRRSRLPRATLAPSRGMSRSPGGAGLEGPRRGEARERHCASEACAAAGRASRGEAEEGSSVGGRRAGGRIHRVA
eukprot:3074932-Pyramimonas_sp.AAC.1